MGGAGPLAWDEMTPPLERLAAASVRDSEGVQTQSKPQRRASQRPVPRCAAHHKMGRPCGGMRRPDLRWGRRSHCVRFALP